MTENEQKIFDELTQQAGQIQVLEQKIAELTAGVARMAAYLGVAHTMKDPAV